MASLSTCHLGLWLGWQILLNLDEQLYSKAKELQWENPEVCSKILLRLGSFHIAKNVMKAVGRPQPAYNVGMTLIISCIYVATSNNINATFSQRLVIEVTRTWKFDVATTLKSSRQPNSTSSQRLVINVIRTWKFDIHATL